MEVLKLFPESEYGPDVFRLWFSRSGRRLLVLTGHSGGANRLWNWDVAAGRRLGRRVVVTDSEHDNCFPFPAFDPSLRYMVLDRYVEDRRTRKRIKLEYIDCERTLSPDVRTVFAIGDDFRIDRFDLSWDFEGELATVRYDKARALVLDGKDYADALVVSPAGDLLVVITSNGKALLPFRLEDGAALPRIELPTAPTDGERMMMEPYGRMQFSPDGRSVAVAGDGVFVADPLGERPVLTLDSRHFTDLAFTPDGSRLVGVRPDGSAVVWDPTSGEAITSLNLKAEAGALRAVAIAPDGQTAVAGGTLGRLVRWDL